MSPVRINSCRACLNKHRLRNAVRISSSRGGRMTSPLPAAVRFKWRSAVSAVGRGGYSAHDLHKNKFANAGLGISKYPWIVKHLVRKIGNCLLEKSEISYIRQ